jgi:SAM-dependent methyltransferase
MEQSVYAVEAAVEAEHWWFRGRRKLFSDEIRRLGVPPTAQIVDVGTGTGTNLRLLRELGFSRVEGVDFSDDAIRFCRDKGLGEVIKSDVYSLPFADGSLDLVLMTDVVEHVEDDRRAIAEAARVLRPGGALLITVPAFQALWGRQDDVSHHLRRYRLRQLTDVLRSTGFAVERAYYFNYLLFMPIWLARQIIRILGAKLDSENQVNTALLNRLLYGLFLFDVRTAPHLRPPFGVSALAVARRSQTRTGGRQ